MLGVIENNRARFLLQGPRLQAMLGRVGVYLGRDNSTNPLYPTFRTPDEKRVKRNIKAKKARAAKSQASVSTKE